MANIKRINQKIEQIKERRDKIEANTKVLMAEAKKLSKQMDELENNMKLMLCGQFKDLLERNAISIKDVNLDEVVKAISDNKDAYVVKKSSSALSADAAEESKDKSAAYLADEMAESEKERF